MKRLLLSLLAILLVIMLIGCGETTPSMPTPEVTEPTEQPIPIPEPTPTEEQIPQPEIIPSPAPEPTPIEESDFRNIKWGMNRDEVKEHEIEGLFLAEHEHMIII